MFGPCNRSVSVGWLSLKRLLFSPVSSQGTPRGIRASVHCVEQGPKSASQPGTQEGQCFHGCGRAEVRYGDLLSHSLFLSLLAEARSSPLLLCPQHLAYGGFSVNTY